MDTLGFRELKCSSEARPNTRRSDCQAKLSPGGAWAEDSLRYLSFLLSVKMTCQTELLALLVGKAPSLLPRPVAKMESLSRGRETGAAHRATLG